MKGGKGRKNTTSLNVPKVCTIKQHKFFVGDGMFFCFLLQTLLMQTIGLSLFFIVQEDGCRVHLSRTTDSNNDFVVDARDQFAD